MALSPTSLKTEPSATVPRKPANLACRNQALGYLTFDCDWLRLGRGGSDNQLQDPVPVIILITLHPKFIVAQARVPRKPSTVSSSSVAFAAISTMLTPSLGGRERIDFSHKARNGHRESISVPRDPGPSISTFDSDVGYLGRAMHELFPPMTSEVTSAWDAGFQFFHPPPPPPPPPRHRRSSTLWDISAAVPKERPENDCEVHWSNPYGPDPPSEVAPPAAKPMIEDSFQKATKLSAISSSSREEGYRPDSTVADDISNPCSSIPPMEEPAFSALANLRMSAEMGGPPVSFTLSEFYSMQGPLSPCSFAPTECHYGREDPGTQGSDNRLSRQAPWSPAPTEYPYKRQTSWSPASTTCDDGAFDAPLPEYNGGQGLAGGFNPKFPPGAPSRPDDLLCQHNDCPLGMPPPDDSTAHHHCRKEVIEHCLENCSSQWCGLFSSCG